MLLILHFATQTAVSCVKVLGLFDPYTISPSSSIWTSLLLILQQMLRASNNDQAWCVSNRCLRAPWYIDIRRWGPLNKHQYLMNLERGQGEQKCNAQMLTLRRSCRYFYQQRELILPRIPSTYQYPTSWYLATDATHTIHIYYLDSCCFTSYSIMLFLAKNGKYIIL